MNFNQWRIGDAQQAGNFQSGFINNTIANLNASVPANALRVITGVNVEINTNATAQQ